MDSPRPRMEEVQPAAEHTSGAPSVETSGNTMANSERTTPADGAGSYGSMSRFSPTTPGPSSSGVQQRQVQSQNAATVRSSNAGAVANSADPVVNTGVPTSSSFAAPGAVGAEDVGWDRVETFAATEDAPHEQRVHRLHEMFRRTALPTGIVIGLVSVGCYYELLIEAHVIARVVATYCAIMSVVMTSLLMFMHLSAYTSPVQQRRILRILILVPVYAVDSCIALWNRHTAPYFGLLRDGYESYVIYQFYHLLMGYCGGEEAALASRPAQSVNWMFPMCCLGSFRLTRHTLATWKFLLTQYMVLKPFLSILAILLLSGGYYDETSWSFRNPHVHFVILLNISVTLAFTSLVYFFVVFRDLLAPNEPLGKFAAVKAVVFLSFWQSVALGLLVHYGFVKGSREGVWTKEEVSTGVQDFLICIEMLVMTYIHHHVFPETPYVPIQGHGPVKWWQVSHALSIRDVVDDTIDTVVLPVRDAARNGAVGAVAVPVRIVSALVVGATNIKDSAAEAVSRAKRDS